MSTTDPPPRDRALVGTKYRAYKRATEKLADWLTSTAQELGTIEGLSKEVDQKAPAASCGLSISLFVKLTNVIINAKPRVEVPLDIVDVAEKAFFARQERADLLQGTDLDSDVRHQYFITILGEVCEKLKTHRHASRKRVKDPAPKDSTEQANLAPSFQMLDLDPLESGNEGENGQSQVQQLPAKSSNKDKKKKKKKKLKRASPYIEEEEDPYFVLLCLLSDLKAMREYVKEIWQEYKDGKTDLITVSLTTNAAFDVIRTYEDDFPAISSLLADYTQTMELMLSRKVGRCDEGMALFLHPKTGRDEYNEEHVLKVAASLAKFPKVADLILASAFYFLRGPRYMLLKWVRGSKKVLATGEGKVERTPLHEDHFSTYRLGQEDSHPVNTMDSFRRDLRTLAQFARSVYMPGERFLQVIPDHISLQWRDEYAVYSDKNLNLAQVFASQIYLDIHNVLGQDCRRGFEDLCATSERMKGSIESWKLNKLKSVLQEEVTEQVYINLNVAEDLVRVVLKKRDEAILLRQSSLFFKSVGTEMATLTLKLFSPMELHPLHCGIILFQMVHLLRDSGLVSAHQFSTVEFAGQFYFLCQMHRKHYQLAPHPQHKTHIPQYDVPLRWADMDYLFQLLGESAFFEGRVPEKNKDFVASVQRASESASPTGHFGPVIMSPQPGKVTFPKDDLYSYEPIAVTHRLFYSKYGRFSDDDSQIYKWTLETLQYLLENHLSDNFERIKPASSKQGKDGDITQVNILQRLKEALQNESRALHFDFLSFHITCLKLFRNIAMETHHYFFNNTLDVKFPDDDTTMCRIFDIIMFKVNSYRRHDDWLPLCLYIGRKGKGVGGINTGTHTAFTTDGTVMTNKMHVAIDASLQSFLKDNTKHDKEIKKMAGVWGLSKS